MKLSIFIVALGAAANCAASYCNLAGRYSCGGASTVGTGGAREGHDIYVCNAQKQWQLSAKCGKNCCVADGAFRTAHCKC